MDIVDKLAALHRAARQVGGVQPQTLGFETWQLRASGNTLYALIEAAEEIKDLRAECETLLGLLSKCVPQIVSNRETWLEFRDEHTSPDVLAIADRYIAECDELFLAISTALAAKGE